MKLDLSEILTHVGMRYVYTVEEPPLVDEDLECTAPITGEIVFTNTGSALLIAGQIMSRAALPCSRCLAYYEEPVRAPIDEQFVMEMTARGPHGRPGQIVVEEDENPDAGKLFDGPLFDLTELLRQHVMLALPSRPLHDEACRGLCPTCGQDLNEGSCDCETEVAHPSLARLGALLDKTTRDT